MRAATWALSLLLLTVGCSPAEPESKPSPELDGLYFASTGPHTWASFKDRTYVLWSSDARCVDVDTAPADCAEKGTVTTDASKGEVVFTSDAGKVTTRKMSVNATQGPDGLLKTSAVHVTSLVNDAPDLVEDRGDGSPTTVASNVSLVEPGQTQLAANTFQKIGIVCRVVSLIVNPINAPVVVPVTAPKPIVEQQCSGQG